MCTNFLIELYEVQILNVWSIQWLHIIQHVRQNKLYMLGKMCILCKKLKNARQCTNNTLLITRYVVILITFSFNFTSSSSEDDKYLIILFST